MAARSTMASLITRERVLINDPAGTSQVFDDQTIQDVLDESRQDIFNLPLKPQPTYTGQTVSFLDYLADLGGWEDGMVLRQYLTTVVTPSTIEPIAGHFTFAASTYPPVFLTGKLYDVYRAAADLLERWEAKYLTRFDFTSDSQSFRLSHVSVQMEKRIHTLRQKQRVGLIAVTRGGLSVEGDMGSSSLVGPREIDYMASG